MINPVACPKCRKLNSHPTGAPDEACPHCGVIYSKALPSAQRPPPPPAVQLTAPLRTNPVGAELDFLTRLRSDSSYPAFRAVIGIATLFGYILAVVSAIGGLIAAFKGAGLATVIGAVAGGAALYIFTRVFKEMWLMLADLTDATIRIARDGERS